MTIGWELNLKLLINIYIYISISINYIIINYFGTQIVFFLRNHYTNMCFPIYLPHNIGIKIFCISTTSDTTLFEFTAKAPNLYFIKRIFPAINPIDF